MKKSQKARVSGNGSHCACLSKWPPQGPAGETGHQGLSRSEPARPGTRWCLLFLMSAVALAYANTFFVPFVFDDIPNIYANPHVQMDRFGLEKLIDAGFNSPSANRPVANISFALNYFFHGYRAPGYHLVNLAVHMLTGVVLFLLARATLGRVAHQKKTGLTGSAPAATVMADADNGLKRLDPRVSATFPFWLTALWLLNPVHTQTVTYIVQRMNGLAAMFFLISLYAYVRARTAALKWQKGIGFCLCGLSAAMALGSKENAITLPIYLFLYEWFFFQNLDRAWIRKMVPLIAVLALLGTGIVFCYMGASPLEQVLKSYTHREFTIGQRLLTQLRVVLFYLTLIIFPHPSRLNLDHHFALSSSLTHPMTTLVAGLILAAISVFAIVSARRARMISFAILWFLGNLALESSVIGLEMVFEHRTYLPSMAVCGLGVAFLYRWIPYDRIRLMVLLMLVTVCGLWTHDRNAVWREPLSLWADCVEKSPEKARPRNKFGAALEKKGLIGQAKAQYLEALRIDPANAYAYFNLGNIFQKEGDLALAKQNFRRAIHLVPENAEARNNLGVILANAGRVDAAVEQFEQAVKYNPASILALRNLSGLLVQTGQIEAAAKALEKVLAMDDQDAGAYYLLGRISLERGDRISALKNFVRATELNPRHVDAQTNAGIVLADEGRNREALAHFKTAAKWAPGNQRVLANLERAIKNADKR